MTCTHNHTPAESTWRQKQVVKVILQVCDTAYMTNPGVCSSEVDPLKGEEGDVGDAGVNAHTSPKKKGVCSGGLRLSRLSGWRTAAFLLSLFLCLTIVFAFSFILPCPTRPQYQVTWNRTLPAAAAYDFLAIEHANKDKVKDVLFIYKSKEDSGKNITCENEGLSSPCIWVMAVDGTDGEDIWERPLDADLRWAQCGLDGLDGESSGCLVAHADTLTAISTHNGTVLWQRSSAVGAVAPVLSVPDLDDDKTDDIALLKPQHNQMKLVFLSGKTGLPIGSEVEVVDEVSSSHMLHKTASEAQYLLLQTGSGLYAEGLWNLVAKADLSKQLKKDPKWEARRNGTGPIMIYESPSLQQVLRVAVGPGVPSLLLIMDTSAELDLESTITELLDGDTLTSLWKTTTSKLLSQPSFGHFNKDSVPDVVIEEDAGNATKRVVILDGKTGGVLWEVTLLALPHTPAPASVLTINSYSVFMLWGEKLSNQTGLAMEKHFSYLLHPSHSNLLLERSSPVENIVAFKATLLERGRHASYLLLTGHQASEGVVPEEGGVVVLTKRKLKSDVPDSRVLSVSGPVTEDKVEDVKEAFNRLRFSD